MKKTVLDEYQMILKASEARGSFSPAFSELVELTVKGDAHGMAALLTAICTLCAIDSSLLPRIKERSEELRKGLLELAEAKKALDKAEGAEAAPSAKGWVKP